MSHQHPADFSPADFSGSAPLFPLPNAVFYPHAIFPLHIFEQRYRAMTADALDGDRLIAMALMKPGWELRPEGTVAEIHKMVCLSRITAEEKLPDGRYYLVLQGLFRAKVLRETPTSLPYRVGELELCDNHNEGLTDSEDLDIRTQLLRGIQSLHPELTVSPMFVEALDRDLPLGVFCDVLAHALRLPTELSQALLDELNVQKRSQLLLKAIRAEATQQKQCTPVQFPPKFSRN